MQRITVLLLFILTLTLSAHAENRYVTDQILVALRPAQNDTAPPLDYLATGMRVEVVEDLGTFLKIKSSAGAVGFARSKYFIPTPPAGATGATAALQEQLAALLKQNTELSAKLQRLKSAPTTGDTTVMPQELKKSRNDLAELSKRYQELEQSRGESTAIIQERDELKQEVARLKETSKNNAPSSALSGGSQLQWFLAGAAILLIGWFAGRSSRPKRHF